MSNRYKKARPECQKCVKKRFTRVNFSLPSIIDHFFRTGLAAGRLDVARDRHPHADAMVGLSPLIRSWWWAPSSAWARWPSPDTCRRPAPGELIQIGRAHV